MPRLPQQFPYDLLQSLCQSCPLRPSGLSYSRHFLSVTWLLCVPRLYVSLSKYLIASYSLGGGASFRPHELSLTRQIAPVMSSQNSTGLSDESLSSLKDCSRILIFDDGLHVLHTTFQVGDPSRFQAFCTLQMPVNSSA